MISNKTEKETKATKIISIDNLSKRYVDRKSASKTLNTIGRQSKSAK